MKKPLTLVLTIIFLIIIALVYRFNFTNEGDVITTTKNTDVKSSSYVIDGETFALVDRKVSKEIAPGSASKQTVEIFGQPVYGDLTGDGIQDAALMLTSDGGGSGIFYYSIV